MSDSPPAARQALQALREGALVAAERLSQTAYRQAPEDPFVLAVHGAVLSARGSHHEAARVYRRLTQIDPRQPQGWMNLGTALRAAGRHDEALAAYQEAMQRSPPSADLRYNVGLLMMDRGEFVKAREQLALAASLKPRDGEIRFQYARACFSCVDLDQTLEALRDWRQFEGLNAEMLASIASMLQDVGDPASADAILTRLLSEPDPRPELQLQLAAMLERVNRLDEARQRFAKVAERLPREPQLESARLAVASQLAIRDSDWVGAEQLLRAALERTPAMVQRQQHLFPLAKVLDAQGEYARAAEAIREAHASQVASLPGILAHEPDHDRPLMAITRHGCDPADVAGWRDDAPPSVNDSPAFIVAFPRSGTTLLEQTLDAHPELHSIDETSFLQKTTLKFAEFPADYPARLSTLSSQDLSALRHYYWGLAASKAQRQAGQRLLDKNPLNMLRLPAIRRLFPHAPVVLAVRHPCDVIISNYFQHYRAPEFIRLCRDVETLALAYRRAFDYWYEQLAILPGPVLEVRYESFVSDFENEARRVASFLELEWHPEMSAPGAHARNRGYISTPSYSQVVQPINQKAVGRWRRYAALLAPALPLLRPYLDRWGYEA